jgi:hypothetical protein
MVVDAIADRGRAPLGVGCWTLSVERFPLVNFLLETHSLPALARRYPCGFTFYVADPFAPFFLLNFYFVLFWTLTEPTTELSEKAEPEPAQDKLNIKDLALTKDASDIDYKTLVEHVVFKSKANVKSTCTELSANLKGQGWTKQGSDLVTPASAILKRKRSDAALTIFVKPESGGSEVKMFTEGLAWDEK